MSTAANDTRYLVYELNHNTLKVSFGEIACHLPCLAASDAHKLIDSVSRVIMWALNCNYDNLYSDECPPFRLEDGRLFSDEIEVVGGRLETMLIQWENKFVLTLDFFPGAARSELVYSKLPDFGWSNPPEWSAAHLVRKIISDVRTELLSRILAEGE